MHWLILVVTCLILIISLFYKKYWCPFVIPLSKVPGLTGAELWRTVYKCRRTERLKAFATFFHSYGPIIKTWFGVMCYVHIGSAEYAQKILSCPVNVNKLYLYGFIKPWLGDSLPLSKREKWHERRKLLTPAFHFNILNEYIGVMVKNVKTFTEKLEKEVNSKAFDIVPYITMCSMNTIGETAMNMNLAPEKRTSETFVGYVHEIVYLAAKRFLSPLLHFDMIHVFSKNRKMIKDVAGELHKMSRQIIDENLSRRRDRRISCQATTHDDEIDSERKRLKTFLDILLDKYEEGDGALTLEDIREEVDAFIFTGYDTVTAAISCAIFLVGHHPEVQERIHAELDSVLPTDDTPVNAKTLAEMNYLDCVMKESLRLYSPGSTIGRSLTQPLSLDKYTLPAGTDVVIHIHAIHRSPEYYVNPHKFDPSNFFPENAKKLHPFAYIPFSAGPRNCIGQKFAKLEFKVALALFFKKYAVESMTKMEDLQLITELVLQPKNGIFVKIKKRQ